jgi:hypothetical protein
MCWIAAIQRVTVMQVNHRRQRFFMRGRPFDDLLPPVHAVIPVDDAAPQQLGLLGVPQSIVFERVPAVSACRPGRGGRVRALAAGRVAPQVVFSRAARRPPWLDCD